MSTDDPYFYLYYGEAPRPKSYFELEAQQAEVGRVIRFDSLSKVLSAGIRIGFVSGPPAILEAIDMHTAILNFQPSSLSQAVVFALLDAWGYETFIKHTVVTISAFYRSKRDVFEAAMRRHLDGLAEWTAPEAGMFYWFKLLLPGDEPDSQELIAAKAIEKNVLALPGTVFLPSGQKTAFVRCSFSILDEEMVNEALRRLREVILEARAGV